MHNLHEIKRKAKKEESDDEESEDEEEDDPEKQPKLRVSGIKHNSGMKLM